MPYLKIEMPAKFQEIIEVFGKDVSLEITRNVFLILHPDKSEFAARIFRCLNCESLFWVKRMHKNAANDFCEKCSNLGRQRRFVQENRDVINKNRRGKYAQNKQGQKNKERHNKK